MRSTARPWTRCSSSAPRRAADGPLPQAGPGAHAPDVNPDGAPGDHGAGGGCGARTRNAWRAVSMSCSSARRCPRRATPRPRRARPGRGAARAPSRPAGSRASRARPRATGATRPVARLTASGERREHREVGGRHEARRHVRDELASDRRDRAASVPDEQDDQRDQHPEPGEVRDPSASGPKPVEAFHSMCRAMAAARPPSGASTRRGPGGLVAALATPRPVSAVHSGCSRG